MLVAQCTQKSRPLSKIVLSANKYKELIQSVAVAEYERDKALGRLKKVKSISEIN